jgi:hypothetical protein
MRRQVFGFTIVSALALTGDHPSAQAPSLRSVMREKLTNTQQLLEGVVTANFTIIDRSADRLGQLSYTEIGSWQANAQPEYLKQASAFVKAVQDLRRAAANRNSDAAANAYATLLNSCVSCHSFVRRGKPIRFTTER